MEDFEVVPVGTKAHIAELEEKIRGLELKVEGLTEALNSMYLQLGDEDKIAALEDEVGYLRDCLMQLDYSS